MKIWNWIENKFSKHFSIGPVTFYGANAMHWAINVQTRRWGYVCFRLPLPCFGKWWPLYLYFSPNATPWASTFMIGGYRDDAKLAPMRRRYFGHNFNTELHRDALRYLNSRG